jgi:hypothetical protein
VQRETGGSECMAVGIGEYGAEGDGWK